jgi:hypothetical protein
MNQKEAKKKKKKKKKKNSFILHNNDKLQLPTIKECLWREKKKKEKYAIKSRFEFFFLYG